MRFWRKKRAGGDGGAAAPPDEPVGDSPPLTAPILVDLGSRKVRYAGEGSGGWFVSHLHEPRLLCLTTHGAVRDTFTCPPVDRVLQVGSSIIGVQWTHAWGRDWGYVNIHDPEHATGYDARTGRTLWHMAGGLAGLVGGRRAMGRVRVGSNGPHVCFDVATGEQFWTVRAADPAIGHDDERIYLVDQSGRMSAFEIATGKQVWTVHPPEERRISGNLCRVLVPTPGGVWYATHTADEQALLIRIGATDGKLLEEVAFEGWVSGLRPAGDGVFAVHEFGVARVAAGGIEPLVEDVPDPQFGTSGQGFAAYARGADTLVYASDRAREPCWIGLNAAWSTLHVSDGVAVLSSESQFLRWPLAYEAEDATRPVLAAVVRPALDSGELEPAVVVFGGPSLVLVEHPTRGRLTLKATDTGLKKNDHVRVGGFVVGPGGRVAASVLEYRGREGSPVRVSTSSDGELDAETAHVEIGDRITAPTGEIPPTVAHALSVLAEFDLLDPVPIREARKLALRGFPDGHVGSNAVAWLLASVHGQTGGLARGFLSHDWQFGKETDDVIAEFAQALDGEPVAFTQMDRRPDRLLIRTTKEGTSSETWVETDHAGLDAVAAHLTEALEAAGATRRVYALETEDDWHAYLIVAPDTIEGLRSAGLEGIPSDAVHFDE